MRRRLISFWKNEDGSAAALVAVSLTALVSIMALGLDIGMLFNARSEAQRAADSAALAGASAFLDFPANEATKPAHERAIEYATQNTVRNSAVDPSEVEVHVNVHGPGAEHFGEGIFGDQVIREAGVGIEHGVHERL